MKLRVFFGQRKERYEGQFLPEVLEATTVHQIEDECEWFQKKVDEISVKGRDEFSGFAMVDIELTPEQDDEIRKRCLGEVPLEGKVKVCEPEG
jgi:hypothetical protein